MPRLWHTAAQLQGRSETGDPPNPMETTSWQRERAVSRQWCSVTLLQGCCERALYKYILAMRYPSSSAPLGSGPFAWHRRPLCAGARPLWQHMAGVSTRVRAKLKHGRCKRCSAHTLVSGAQPVRPCALLTCLRHIARYWRMLTRAVSLL